MSGMRYLSAALAAFALAGCVKLLPDPPAPPRLYPLEAGDVARVEGARVAAVAGVAEPEGPQALMGDAIVWRREGTIAFMSNAAWPGRAADLLQSMLAETITRQGLLHAGVSNRGAGVRNDVEVRWDVSAFDIDENAGLEARFIAHVRVVSTRDRKLLRAEIVEEREPFADRSGREAVNALARAARRGCARIALLTAEAAQSSRTEAAEAERAASAAPAGDQPSAASTRR